VPFVQHYAYTKISKKGQPLVRDDRLFTTVFGWADYKSASILSARQFFQLGSIQIIFLHASSSDVRRNVH
jgi:hypothetical protein